MTELKIDDESLAYLLNKIQKQIRDDRDVAYEEYDRLSKAVPEIKPNEADGIFVAQTLAKSLRDYLDIAFDSSDRLLKIARILSERLNKSEVTSDPVLSMEERNDIEKLVKATVNDRNAR